MLPGRRAKEITIADAIRRVDRKSFGKSFRESEMVGLDVARLFLKTKPRVCGQVSAAAWF